MTCNDVHPVLARYADDDSALAADVRHAVEAHLTGCAACRAALDEQRDVTGLLRARLATPPVPGLVARVSARIDGGQAALGRAGGRDEQGWLGLANWRAWTVGLVPVAAALVIAAYIPILGVTSTSTAPSVPATFEDVTMASAPAALQPSVTGDALIEAVLTGTAPSSGDPDER